MRFYCFILCFFLFSPAFGQPQFVKLVKENFRVNPFEGNINSFIKTLVYDPELLTKKEIKKTDTSLYFIQGSYKAFNPFNFKAQKTDIIFAELQDEIITDSRIVNMASYTYQILVYTDDNEAYRKLVVKEYQQLKKQLKKGFPESEVISLKGVKNIEDGEVANYALRKTAIYPATVSWQTLGASKKIVLTILLRLVNDKNYLVPYGYSHDTPFRY